MSKFLPIVTYGKPLLRKKSKPVTKINDKFVEVLEDMYYTMEHANGIGIAAPQVNIDSAFAIVDISCIDEYRKLKPIILINPKILEVHGESIHEEGCLSIPNIRAEISRPETIFLRNYDLNMKESDMEISGFLARVIQHEIDHLNGKLFIDYIPKDELNKLKNQLKKIKKGIVKVDYPIIM